MKGGGHVIDFVKVGARIAECRKKNGLSQEELAERLYVTRQAISKWENGTSVPSIDTLCEISRMFKISFEEILGLFDNEKLEIDKKDIFRGHDRSFIISKIVSGEIKLNIHEVFYQMSPAERMYILKNIKEGNLKTRMDELWVKLTPSEQRYIGGMICYEA